mgnify:CR=1 FL=1
MGAGCDGSAFRGVSQQSLADCGHTCRNAGKGAQKTATLTDAGWPLQLTFRCETGSLDVVLLVEDVKDQAQRDQTDNTFVSEC